MKVPIDSLPEPRSGVAPPAVSVPPGQGTRLDEGFSQSYEDLRELARILVRRQGVQELSATSLVNEVWLKLTRSKNNGDFSPLHMKHLAAKAMRQVMVDLSRYKRAQRRGAGQILVTFDESLYMNAAVHLGPELLALNAALEALALFAPRQAALVEARFFGGFTWEELAGVFKISEATVMRDWRAARSWLAREVRNSLPGGPVTNPE